MQEKPCVTIGLPVYNGEEHLEEAIDSVRAQTFDDFEIVISDNASSDRTLEICRDYAAIDERIRVLQNQANLGAGPNFNATFKNANGVFFKWMAHDDVVAPEYLEHCIHAFRRASEGTVLVFPRRKYISHEGHEFEGEPHLVGPPGAGTFDKIPFRVLISTCGSRYPIFVFGLMRSEAVRRTRLMGSYPAADLVFVSELRLLGEFVEIPETLYFQRLHDDSPQVRVRKTTQGDALWFDTANSGRRVYPETRLLIEQFRAITRAKGTPSETLMRLLALTGFVGTRARRKLRGIRNWQRMKLWEAWSRASLAAVKFLDVSSIPLRFWIVAAGLRSVDQRPWIKKAFSRPWFSPNPELLRFAAERLASRNDSGAREILFRWARGDSNAHQNAAAHVLGKHELASGALEWSK